MPSVDLSQSRSKTRSLAIHAVKLILTLIVLYYVGRQVWRNWDLTRAYDWQFNPFYLAASVILAQAAFFIFTTCWKKIISGFGHQISAPMAFRISNLSNLGRYVPGKVWQVFGMLYLARKEGIPQGQAAASFVIIQFFTIPASLLVYVLAAQFESALLTDKFAVMGQGSAYTIGALALAGCAVLVFAPQPILWLLNWILKKTGREAVTFALDKKVALVIFAGYFCGWTVFGLAYWLFLRGVVGSTAPSVITAIGLYNIAYQVGYLMLFAPGGFGPREAVMGELLKPFVGPLGPALAVVARLWSVVIDSLAAVIALCVKK